MTAVLEATDLAAELRAMTSAELAGLRDSALGDAALAEVRRRADLDRARARRRADPVAQEWRSAAWAQFQAAESATNGYLLNSAGEAKGIDPWSLWSGPLWAAERYASWELLRFWEQHARITVTEFRSQAQHDREAETDDAMDRDERGGVRRGDSAGTQSARGDQDRGGYVVPAPDAGAGAAEAEDGRTGTDAGRGAAVRSVILTEDNPVTVIPGPGSQPEPDPLAARRARLQQIVDRAARRSSAGDAERQAMPSPAPVPERPAAVAVHAPGTVAETTGRRKDVDGDETLGYLFTFLKRFAVWGSDAEIVTAALWIAQAHAKDGAGMPVWQYCARLGIFGPSGSGKSWKSRLIGKLAPAGEILLEPTKPSFIDMVADKNTVIITEADELFYTSGRNRGILAVVNASYEPDRTNTRKHGGKVVKVTLFGHVVLDGLDVMLQATRPDLRTMISRTIVMMSAPGPEGYRPPRFDRQARGIAQLLGQRAAAWMAQEVADGMADDVPGVPEHLGNRPFALWEPLFTVAARADRCIARREGTDPDAPDAPRPWSLACAEACQVLEAGAPVIDEDEDEDMSELDRAMAEWAS